MEHGFIKIPSSIRENLRKSLADFSSSLRMLRQDHKRPAISILLGPIAYLLALAGTFTLGTESARLFSVVTLLDAAILAIVAWHRWRWPSAFATPHKNEQVVIRRPRDLWALGGLMATVLIVLSADIAFIFDPTRTFGPAGWLWLSGMMLLLTSTFVWPRGVSVSQDSGAPRWNPPEIGTFAALVILAFVVRVWNLGSYPNNIYPDEIMTGTVASQAYINGTDPPIFSTVWSGIDLPALWFWIVAGFLRFGGTSLAIVRLPAALFGAATVVPFYLLVRMTWGRAAAIAGTAILAFSAADVHYSRLGLNNIVTPFFWTLCFFYVLRGLRTNRPFNWALAGLAAGLSEHFYYGTRLLPFILLAFFAYLLVVHWRRATRYFTGYALAALGYLAGFGPLLAYFIRHANLYFGRGAELGIWHGVPPGWTGVFQLLSKLWPIASENLLGISTRPSQDIIYFAPLLLVPEAALLVLGVALLLWNWRHPAAFLVLFSGVAVFFVGGTLVLSENSVPPQLNHWTPAFPFFYCALALPVGAWASGITWRGVPAVATRWMMPVTLATGLAALGWLNVRFYFGNYHTDPDLLKAASYRIAQNSYDLQVAQSRFVASLGTSYRVIVVSRSLVPYDAETTRYLLGSSVDVVNIPNPENGLPAPNASGTGRAFIFFPGSEQYRLNIHNLYPGGSDGEVHTRSGRPMFYTYTLPVMKP